ncbi:MAG: PEP-CTERM sorting domain-containing protein [Desulfuromonadaceae bacterium]|nr:PEP-CTERM sorting domain-containing protein [Desulfuromonadaceae bacterium]
MNVSKIAARITLAFCLAFSLSAAAGATSYSFSSNDGSNTKNDLNDLDHYKLYVWGIDPASTMQTIAANNEKIIGASISFKNIYNWANEPNDILKVYLVDNPKVVDKTNNGIDVWTATDNQGTSTTPGKLQELTDPLFMQKTVVNSKGQTVANTNFRFESITELWRWTDAVDLQHKGVVTTTVVDTQGNENTTTANISSKSYYGHDLTYNFSAAELAVLMGNITSANPLATSTNPYASFGLGFDPDCHYYNDGITFNIETAPITTPVPEPGTMMLLGAGMFGLAIYGKRRMNKDA